MDPQPSAPQEIVPFDSDGRVASRALQTIQPSPLEVAGQIANRVAGQNIFQRYLSEKSANTIKRHAGLRTAVSHPHPLTINR